MDDHIQERLSAIQETIEKDTKISEEAFEKLLVALTGVFRLLDGKHSILSSLQGSPTEIQGYVLKLIGQIKQQINESYESILTELNLLVHQLENL